MILVLFSQTVLGQEILSLAKNESYPDRSVSDSVLQYISKAEKSWNEYGQEGFERVDVDYDNNRSLQLTFDSSGYGVGFIEFYEDTVGMELYYYPNDSSYSLKRYEWLYGYIQSVDYWYPKEKRREFWHYDAEDELKKILKIEHKPSQKIVDETVFEFYQGTTTRRTYKLENNQWVLESEIIIEE